jgi:hypothetical protein
MGTVCRDRDHQPAQLTRTDVLLINSVIFRAVLRFFDDGRCVHHGRQKSTSHCISKTLALRVTTRIYMPGWADYKRSHNESKEISSRLSSGVGHQNLCAIFLKVGTQV